MIKPNKRSSRPEVFCEKVFLETLQYSQENTCAKVSFLTSLGLQLYFKKRLWHGCFLVNFAKFCETFSYRIPPVAASAVRNTILQRLYKLIHHSTINSLLDESQFTLPFQQIL